MTSRQAIEVYGTIVLCQFLASVVCINLLLPQLLNKGRSLLFVLSLLVLMLLLFALYTSIRMCYLEIRYLAYYEQVMPEYILLGFWERIIDPRLLLAKGINYLAPTALLLFIQYYRNQRDFLKLKEQKKTAELTALKNQLNPHFLFNTLNNLYTLALQKSDKTPDVISRLSSILDYMLYRCNDKYVSLSKEIELIENYIALEKVRYGKRAKVSFDHKVDPNSEIAPLILLTFIENAFKHGVSEEINQASIEIKLSSDIKNINFEISNTIPSISVTQGGEKESIGLSNIKKQLELLYPENHLLKVQRSDGHYQVQLKLGPQ